MAQALDKILIGKAPTQAATSLKTRLAAEGIEIALAHNAGTCKSGCGGNEMEIWAHPDDAQEIARLLEGAWRQQMLAMGYDPHLASNVFDPAANSATCPACGTQFATSQAECPECGLCFAVPDAPPHSGCR